MRVPGRQKQLGAPAGGKPGVVRRGVTSREGPAPYEISPRGKLGAPARGVIKERGRPVAGHIPRCVSMRQGGVMRSPGGAGDHLSRGTLRESPRVRGYPGKVGSQGKKEEPGKEGRLGDSSGRFNLEGASSLFGWTFLLIEAKPGGVNLPMKEARFWAHLLDEGNHTKGPGADSRLHKRGAQASREGRSFFGFLR